VSSRCEEKVRRIQFGIQDRLETIRAGIQSYSGQLENAERQNDLGVVHHCREIITIFEREEKEMMVILEIAESGTGAV
jgi:hypothetical protein